VVGLACYNYYANKEFFADVVAASTHPLCDACNMQAARAPDLRVALHQASARSRRGWHIACEDLTERMTRGSLMNASVRAVFLPAALLAIAARAAPVETPSASDVQLHHLAINKALSSAAPFKEAVESYRRHHDDFPSSNLEAGLQPPDIYKNPDVHQIAIDRGGTINVMLTPSSGVDSGVIVLTPHMPKNSDDFVVEWKCTSANYSDISDATLGVCEYTKLP